MNKISVYIIAYNEVEKIEAAINSVLWADEIIVVDSNSTDGTIEKATEMGARVVQVPFQGFGHLRNQALKACQYNWIFSLDADERCTPEARDEILSIISPPSRGLTAGSGKDQKALDPAVKPRDDDAWDGSLSQHGEMRGCSSPVIASDVADVYYVPRKNFFMGRWIKHSGWYPNYRQPQLFRKGTLSYSNDPVHERFEIHSDKPEGYLKNPIWQAPFKNLGEVMHKANRYSSLGVDKLAEKNKKTSMGRSLTRGLWAFIKHYLFKRGFLDGWPGFVIALGNFYGTYFRYAKYYEQKMNWELPESPPLRRD